MWTSSHSQLQSRLYIVYLRCVYRIMMYFPSLPCLCINFLSIKQLKLLQRFEHNFSFYAFMYVASILQNIWIAFNGDGGCMMCSCWLGLICTIHRPHWGGIEMPFVVLFPPLHAFDFFPFFFSLPTTMIDEEKNKSCGEKWFKRALSSTFFIFFFLSSSFVVPQTVGAPGIFCANSCSAVCVCMCLCVMCTSSLLCYA